MSSFQPPPTPALAPAQIPYSAAVDRRTYIQLLREYDRTRDPTALAEFVPVISIEEPGTG